MRIRWLDVLRDALAIVVLLSVVRMLVAGDEPAGGPLGMAIFGVLVAGFCVAGCLSPARRFAHLGAVALAVWAVTTAIAFQSGVEGWMGAQLGMLIWVVLAMALGGALSLAIVRRPGPPAEAPEPPRDGPQARGLGPRLAFSTA